MYTTESSIQSPCAWKEVPHFLKGPAAQKGAQHAKRIKLEIWLNCLGPRSSRPAPKFSIPVGAPYQISNPLPRRLPMNVWPVDIIDNCLPAFRDKLVLVYSGFLEDMAGLYSMTVFLFLLIQCSALDHSRVKAIAIAGSKVNVHSYLWCCLDVKAQFGSNIHPSA